MVGGPRTYPLQASPLGQAPSSSTGPAVYWRWRVERGRALGSRPARASFGALPLLIASLATGFAAWQCCSAWAQPDRPSADLAAARAEFEAGSRLAEQERWVEAEQAFRRSLDLVDRSPTRFNLAVTLQHQRRFTAMLETLDEYLRTSDPVYDSESRERARSMRGEALRQVADVRLLVSPESSEVRVDGQPLAPGAARHMYLVPGSHVVEAAAEGFANLRNELDVRAGQTVTHRIVLQETKALASASVPPPGSPSSGTPGASSDGRAAAPEAGAAALLSQRDRRSTEPVSSGWSGPSLEPVSTHDTTPGAALGLLVGGSGLVAAGLASGWFALRADRQVVEACAGARPCPRPDLRSKQSRARVLAVTSDVLWATGAVAAAAGLGWMLWSNDARTGRKQGQDEDTLQVAWMVRPGSGAMLYSELRTRW